MATSKKAGKKTAKKATKKPVKKAAKKQIPAARVKKSVSRGAAPAMPESTTLDTLYIVNSSATNVTLEVIAGAAGQTSDMTVMLDNSVVVQKHAGDLPETILGTNSQLNGKKLSIVANIKDTSTDTNLTSLTIHLKGGVSSNDFPLFKTVDEDGDSEDYLCLIEFFNPLL